MDGWMDGMGCTVEHLSFRHCTIKHSTSKLMSLPHTPQVYILPTLWINFFGDLQRIRIGQICVGGGHSEDEAVWFGDELHEHSADLKLNVLRLVTHSDFCHARQIDKRQVED